MADRSCFDSSRGFPRLLVPHKIVAFTRDGGTITVFNEVTTYELRGSTMARLSSSVCLIIFGLSIILLETSELAQGVDREWDDEGTTLNWTEPENWTDDLLPDTADATLIGSLARAHDDTVIFDPNGDTIASLELTNGADLDTDGGRLVMTGGTSIGTGSALGETISELIIRPRQGIALFAIDTNTVDVGANGQLTMLGGEIDVDGTGGLDGLLTVADGGALHGYGLVDLSDSDASLGEVTDLLINDGVIIAGDPTPAGGEPVAVTLQLSTSKAPMFGTLDLNGITGDGAVRIKRNATLKVDPLFTSSKATTMVANATFESAAGWLLAGEANIVVNSGVVDEGQPSELPAAPAVIAGAGVFTSTGTITLDQADEELTISAPFVGDSGQIENQGIVRFTGGGDIKAIALNSTGGGLVQNESSEPLSFQGGESYATPLVNAGTMSVTSVSDEVTTEATVQLDEFTQTALGVLQLDLAGTEAGDFDVLAIDGDVALDGTLEITIDDAFTPAVGNTFEILTSLTGAITGTFATTTFPDLGALALQVNYAETSVELEVVLDQAITGDFDEDGDVDGNDFLRWQRGETTTPISDTDLTDWKDNFGEPSGLAASSVPEPNSGVGLLVLMATATLHRSRQSGLGCINR